MSVSRAIPAIAVGLVAACTAFAPNVSEPNGGPDGGTADARTDSSLGPAVGTDGRISNATAPGACTLRDDFFGRTDPLANSPWASRVVRGGSTLSLGADTLEVATPSWIGGEFKDAPRAYLEAAPEKRATKVHCSFSFRPNADFQNGGGYTDIFQVVFRSSTRTARVRLGLDASARVTLRADHLGDDELEQCFTQGWCPRTFVGPGTENVHADRWLRISVDTDDLHTFTVKVGDDKVFDDELVHELNGFDSVSINLGLVTYPRDKAQAATYADVVCDFGC